MCPHCTRLFCPFHGACAGWWARNPTANPDPLSHTPTHPRAPVHTPSPRPPPSQSLGVMLCHPAASGQHVRAGRISPPVPWGQPQHARVGKCNMQCPPYRARLGETWKGGWREGWGGPGGDGGGVGRDSLGKGAGRERQMGGGGTGWCLVGRWLRGRGRAGQGETLLPEDDKPNVEHSEFPEPGSSGTHVASARVGHDLVMSLHMPGCHLLSCLCVLSARTPLPVCAGVLSGP